MDVGEEIWDLSQCPREITMSGRGRVSLFSLSPVYSILYLKTKINYNNYVD